MKELELVRLVIFCECEHPEHQAVLTYWTDEDNDSCVSMDVHLAKRASVIQRIQYAIKYVLGYQSRYGAFDEIIVNKRTAREMIDFLIKFSSALS